MLALLQSKIPILCEFGDFSEGLDRLRGVKDTARLTAAEINQRFSKSANVSARKLLPDDGGARYTYSDLKVIHAAISFKVFRGHGLGLEEQVRVACGQSVEGRHHMKWASKHM